MMFVVWCGVLIGLTQGAVLDLVNLVHQYEDGLLGGGVGYTGFTDVRETEEINKKTTDIGKGF